MITLTSEFDFNEEVYIIKDSHVIKTRIRCIKFPSVSRFDQNPDDSMIQYGCCTDRKIELGSSVQETESWYDWRFSREIGKTKKELSDKMFKD